MDAYLGDEMHGIEAALNIRQQLGLDQFSFRAPRPRPYATASKAVPAAFLDKTSAQAVLACVINSVAAEAGIHCQPVAEHIA
jgi:hypothetical protein